MDSKSSETIHGWDPMDRDYKDPNFNTYREGPGAFLDLDKQPCYSGRPGKKTGPIKLFVGNIPVSVDKNGLENIFSNYGRPMDIYRRPPEPDARHTWGFVTFETYSEADRAIRERNLKPPFHLKVEFSKGTVVDERVPIIKPKKTYPTEVNESSNRRQALLKTPEPSGRGRGLVLKPFEDLRAVNDESAGRDDSDMARFQPYSGSKYDESNTSLMRGVQRANGPRGPKKFVMGRGCFDRDLDAIIRPQQVKRIGSDVRGSLENYVKSVNGHYEFGKKEFPKADVVGTCTLCAKEATQVCERCKDWYCSRACQETDWPRHKKYCIPPALVYARHFEEPVQEKLQERKSFANKRDTNDDSDAKQFRKDARESFPEEMNGAIPREYGQGRKSTNARENNYSGRKSNDARRDQSSPNSKTRPKENDRGQRNSFAQNTRSSERPDFHKRSAHSKEQDSQVQPVRESLEKCKIGAKSEIRSPESEANVEENQVNSNKMYCFTEELSATSFVKVQVAIPLGPYEFWAQKVDNFRDIIRLSADLAECKGSPLFKPIVGAYCMALYQESWYRGKISSTKPQLKVNFIDFGNEDPPDSQDVKELPDVVSHMKAQAIRIRLAPGTSEKYKELKEGDVLSVKFASKKNDTVVALVEGEDYEEEEKVECNPEIALQNVMVLLKRNLPCYVFITEYNDPEDFVASFVPRNLIDCYNSLFNGKLREKCEEPEDEKYVPELGEAVLAKFSEGWLRGYVVYINSRDEYFVASCDTGLVESVTHVKKMLPKLREIAQFAVHCRVLNNIHKAKKLIVETKRLSVVVKDCTCDSANCEVQSEEGDKICELEVTKWTAPFELYEELKCVDLKDGPCHITAHMSAVDLYVRPLTSSCIELFNLILQDVAKHCLISQPLDHVPKVGEVLAAQFTEDKCFYRAVVREVNRTKGIKVQYIDFGNIEYVTQQSLKPLSEKLRSKVCLTVKVKLKDVLEQPLNEESLRFFKDLVVSEKKLTLKLNPGGGNHVCLYESDGSSVNDTLNKMLQPRWKNTSVSDCTIYTIDDVISEDLEVGSHVDLVINSVVDHNSLLVTNEKSKTFRELKSHLEETIAEYCNLRNEPYTPRDRELCLAKIDGVWCRCSCLCGGTNITLISLDSGIVTEVSHEYIRRMPKDFINLPVCGLFCDVKTTIDNPSKEEKDIMQEYFKIAKVVTAKVLKSLKGCHVKSYLISVPELDELLTNPMC